MNIGIVNAILTEYNRKVNNPSTDASQFSQTISSSGAASSAVADATKLGTNFRTSNDNRPKRTVDQVRASAQEAIDFLNTPEGKVIAAIA